MRLGLVYGWIVAIPLLGFAQNDSPPRIDLHPGYSTGDPGVVVRVGASTDLTVHFSSPLPAIVRWFRDGELISERNFATGGTAVLDIPEVTPADHGTYWAEISNAAGKVQSRWMMIGVRPATRPFLREGPASYADAIFAGLQVDAGGDFPIQTQWLKDGIPIPGATARRLEAHIAPPGSYSVQVRSPGGEVVSPTVRVYPLELPLVLKQQPGSGSQREGDPWQEVLGYELLYPSAASSEVSKDGAEFAAIHSPLFGPTARAADAGVYRFRFRYLNSSVTTEPARLTVLPPASRGEPLIRVHPAGITQPNRVSLGGTLSVELFNPGPGTTYQWRRNGSSVASATTPTLTLRPGLNADDQLGTYDVVVTNAHGSTTSRPAIVDRAGTAAHADAFRSHPASVRTGPGAEVRLSVALDVSNVTTSATGFPRLTWTRNGRVINSLEGVSLDSGRSSLQFIVQSGTEFGTYAAHLEFADGARLSTREAYVEDVEAGQAPFFMVQPSSVAQFRGRSVAFRARVRGASPHQFQWLKDGSPLTGATTSTLQIQNVGDASVGTYLVRVSNGIGSTESAAATLSIIPDGPLVIMRHPASVLTLQPGERRELGVYAGRGELLQYRWVKDGQTVANGTDSHLVVRGTATEAGSYQAIITNLAGESVTSESARVALLGASEPLVSILPNRAQTLPAGRSLSLIASHPAPNESPDRTGTATRQYQWLRNGAPIPGATTALLFIPRSSVQDTGDYLVEFNDDSGASRSASVNVTVTGTPPGALPFVLSTTEPTGTTPIDARRPFTLRARVESLTPVRYEWYRNGILLPQFAGPELSIASLAPSDAGLYAVVVTNTTGSLVALTYNLRVQVGAVPPVILETPPPLVELIGGQSITLALAVESDRTPSVTWTRNGVAVFSSSRAEPFVLSYADDAAGTYVCIARNDHGTASSPPMIVRLAPADPGGIYFGSTDVMFASRGNSETGQMAYVDASGRATLISGSTTRAFVPGRGWTVSPFVAEGLQLVGGAANFTLTTIGGTAGNGATARVTARGGRLTVVPTTGTGSLSATRVLSGPASRFAGRYRGKVSGQPDGDVHAIVAPDGMLGLLISLNGIAYTAFTRTTPDQPAIVQQRDIALIQVRVDSATGEVQGHVVPLSGASQLHFTAPRTDGPLGSQVSNVASRGYIDRRDRAMIAGFTLTGTGQRSILLRGVGPSLGELGVGSALRDTQLALFHGTDVLVENDNWSSADNASAIATTSAAVGAFALPPNSRDAAVLARLAAGGYTAQLLDSNNDGVGLVEIYDGEASESNLRISNVSIRGFAAAGENALIAGVTVSGATPRQMLVRAIGPTLSTFGLTGALGDPHLRLYRGDALVGENDNWSGTQTLQTAAATVGAFGLRTDSRDAALIISLPPGSYTAQVSGNDGGTGITLLEIYELP